MINYTGTIFEQAGSSLSPNMSAIIVAIIQLLGSYVSTILVEKAGRKILYLVSCIGTGIGLSVLGLYINLDSSGYDCSNFKWVPIGSFSMTIFFASIALLTLPFLVIAEILPPKIRALGCNICMALLWVFCFLILKVGFLLVFSSSENLLEFSFAVPTSAHRSFRITRIDAAVRKCLLPGSCLYYCLFARNQREEYR